MTKAIYNKTLRIMIRYARQKAKGEYFNWEKLADEIRSTKGTDYHYYQSFFTYPQGYYDWVRGNENWKELIQCLKDKMTTEDILRKFIY